MNAMRKIINGIEKTNEFVGDVVKFLLLVMAAFLTYEVIARYLFNSPTIWVFDMCKQLMCFIGALGGAYTLVYNGHVKVDVIYGSLSIKGKAIIDIITSVLFFAFIGILIWKSTEMAMGSWAILEKSTSVFAPPLYYMKTAIPVGAILVAFQGVAKLLKDIITLITGEEQPYRTFNTEYESTSQ